MNIPKYTLNGYISLSNGGWRNIIYIYDNISLTNIILNFETFKALGNGHIISDNVLDDFTFFLL